MRCSTDPEGLQLGLPQAGTVLSILHATNSRKVLHDGAQRSVRFQGGCGVFDILRNFSQEKGESTQVPLALPAWLEHAPGPQLPSAPFFALQYSTAEQRKCSKGARRMQEALSHLQLLLAGHDFLALGLDQPLVGLQKLRSDIVRLHSCPSVRLLVLLLLLLGFSEVLLEAVLTWPNFLLTLSVKRRHHNCSLRVDRVPTTTLVVSGALCRES